MGGCAITKVGLHVLEPVSVRNRTPDHSARSYSLYRLSRSGSIVKDLKKIHSFTICIKIVLQHEVRTLTKKEIGKYSHSKFTYAFPFVPLSNNSEMIVLRQEAVDGENSRFSETLLPIYPTTRRLIPKTNFQTVCSLNRKRLTHIVLEGVFASWFYCSEL
jgi:hypothetical protein